MLAAWAGRLTIQNAKAVPTAMRFTTIARLVIGMIPLLLWQICLYGLYAPVLPAFSRFYWLDFFAVFSSFSAIHTNAPRLNKKRQRVNSYPLSFKSFPKITCY
jgi:hypothetical protein